MRRHPPVASARLLAILSVAAVVAGVALLAMQPACATAGVPEARGAERAIWEGIDLPSITACGRCHADVYDEWSASLHHGAWSNQNVLTATNDFAKKECRSCHSPMPVLPNGLKRRPKFRDFNQDDGVHCLSCHGLGQEDGGGVAAARTIEGAPCRPRYEPRLLQAELCYPCHEPTHQAFAEYRRSSAAATRVRCVDCHMQPTGNRGGRRHGRSHGPNGGFNREFVARAVGFRCWIADRTVHVELHNRCGHKFPGEIPSRSFLVRVMFTGAARPIDPALVLLRRQHKGEDRKDNRLRPDEVRDLRFDMPDGTTGADVQLLFKPLPLLPVEASFQIGEWSSSK